MYPRDKPEDDICCEVWLPIRPWRLRRGRASSGMLISSHAPTLSILDLRHLRPGPVCSQRRRRWRRYARRGPGGRAHKRAVRRPRRLRQGPARLPRHPRYPPRADRCQEGAAEPAGAGRLPRPPQGHEHLQGPHRCAAVAHRAAQQVQRAAGLLRCRHRAADRGVRRAVPHHAGAAGWRAGIRDAVQGRLRAGPGDCARQGPRCRHGGSGGPHQPRAVLCRDQRQPEHRQCALQPVQGQPADGRRRGSQGAQRRGRR